MAVLEFGNSQLLRQNPKIRLCPLIYTNQRELIFCNQENLSKISENSRRSADKTQGWVIAF